VSYVSVPPPLDSNEAALRPAISSDRSRSNASDVSSVCSGWCSSAVTLLACCVIFVVLGCGYTANVSTASGASSLQVSPSTIDFGAVPVGQTANTAVSLSNRGAEAVEVSQFSVAGQTFSIDNQSHLPVKIAPGGAYSVNVGFKPSDDTSYSGKLTALDSASRTVAQSVLSGSGVTPAYSGTPTLYVSSNSLSFGNVTVGSSASLVVTLASIGSAPVTISSASIGGSGYSFSGATFPLTLYHYQSVTLVFTFAPTKAGTLTGKLVLNSNSSTGSSTYINMTGNGVGTTPSPLLTVSSNSLTFGNVAVASSATIPVTLTSSGTSALTISSASIGGSGYSFSGASFPLTLNPGQSATLQFKFAPTVTGAGTGTMTLDSNSSAGSATTINMTGNGVTPTTGAVLAMSSHRLNFGNVAVGSSATIPVTLTSAGTSAVTISSAPIVGSGYSYSGAGFPLTLSPGQSATLQFKFAPTTTGAWTSTMTLHGNSIAVTVGGQTFAGAVSYIYLSGNGVTPTTNPQLTVSPSLLAFGNVAIGSSATLPVTLTSSGGSAVTVNSATLSGSSFTMSGATFPVTLSPQQSITLQVQFAPAATNSATGMLTISSNSSTNGTVGVSLSGAGALHQVNLSWQAPSSSSDPVAGYHIYRATGSSSSYSLLNSPVDTQTSYVDSVVTSGTNYTYYVKSVDASGNESSPSNSVTVTIP